ncbi:HEPN domain-containing protein [Polynucleobacter sp. AM-25C3]|uniref:HEPN domain-containing protein n=1 Tax=Polynucleobacter sp. AM-25C3 TaxID=1855569 RepID=UPI001C0E700D|nr:HEPN domain-containing protein [Polynucleobacter sp. AM-25C3]MBU3602403.1 HEPN domain-containing protein [Polynucleobacter sp. AM-25C3]
MNSKELFTKAKTAATSAQILLNARDFDGACNRAYYAMFDAARAALLSIGDADSVLTIKSHSGLISAFSLKLVKVGKVSLDLGKSLNKVEDLRLMDDYKGDLVEEADAAWAVQQATIFVDNLSKSFE